MDPKLKTYIESCKSKVTGYLEGATRFGGQNLSFTREVSDLVEVQVSVTHSLATAVSTEESVGAHQPAGQDLGFNSSFDYNSGVEAARRAELAKPDNLSLLERQLPSISYTQASEALSLRKHSRRLFHTYKCQSCVGKGAHECKACSGKGKEGCPECRAHGAHECDKCGGKGKTKCTSCGGSGKGKCPKCHGSKTMPNPERHDDFYASNTIPCDYCGGSGHIRCRKCTGLFSFRSGKVKCKSCKGKGEHTCKTCKGKKQITCHTCDGHGSHQCHDCEGQGHFTSISEVQLISEPRRSLSFPASVPDEWREALDAVSADDLGRLGEVKHLGTDLDREAGTATLRFSIQIPVCELESNLNDEASTWLLMGEAPEIKQGGVALETLLSGDLAKLTSLADSNPYSVAYKSRAEPVLKLVLESEINQQLVDNLLLPQASGQAPNELDFDYDRLTKSVGTVVSANYVSAMVYSLWKVCEGAAVSAVVRAGLMAAVLAPLILFMIVAGFVQVFGLDVDPGATKLVVFYAGGAFQTGVALAVGALTAWGAANAALMLHGRWLKQVVGAKRWPILREAYDVNLALAAKVLVMALSAASTWAVYRVFPLWIDLDGKYYGIIPSMASLIQL